MNHNILYSFRRCPYAIRARWALLNTNEEVILREIDLKNKPSSLIKISKKATVPVLQRSTGEVIDESLEIMTWTIKKSNRLELLGNNNKHLEKIHSLIKTNDLVFKYHLDRFKYAYRFKKSDLEKHREAGMEILIALNAKLELLSKKGNPLFLVNSQESLADWAIWPFVRQFRLADKLKFDENMKIQYIRKWLNYFLSSKKYEIVMEKFPIWSPNQEEIIFGKQKSNLDLKLF